MYKRSGIVCVIAGGLTAIAMSFAQDAHADEASFLQALHDDGLPVSTTALAVGHQVCLDVVTNGVDGVDTEVRAALAAGFTHQETADIIGDAAIELCPSAIPAVKSWAAQHRKESA